MTGRLAGKSALVTGAAGGIGHAIALRFGEEGARVTLCDRDAEKGRAVAAALVEAGIAATFALLDVTEEASWLSAVDAAQGQHGPLDILVNNAGIVLPPPDSFEETSFADWRRVMAVNLDGVFLGTRAGVQAMKGQGGSIINMGSVAAYIGTPGGAAYGSSKGGVRTLTKQAAIACAKKGYRIRINAIHPCYVWTPLVEARATSVFGEERAKEEIRAMHPFRCLAEPVDVANAALFLASDESRLINAADLVVDGALLAQ